MKIIKLMPFILIFVGTFGLLAAELSVIPGPRYLILTFAGLNVFGLVTLVLTLKKV